MKTHKCVICKELYKNEQKHAYKCPECRVLKRSSYFDDIKKKINDKFGKGSEFDEYMKAKYEVKDEKRYERKDTENIEFLY